MKVSVVIPCYKSKIILKRVIKNIPKFVSYIILVDDKCPENTVLHCLKNYSDKRIYPIFNKKNLGVGGSVINGYKKALKLKSDIIIKVDSDGQMDLSKMKKMISIFKENSNIGYLKANRFYSFKSILKIPTIRLIGNFILTIINKFSSGYWKINDPTNGYTAIRASYCKKLKLNKIKKNFFFESDMLHHLYTINTKVLDIDVESKYNFGNSSNLVIHKIIPYFIKNHLINFFKRIYRNKILFLFYNFTFISLIVAFLFKFEFIYLFNFTIISLTIFFDILNEPR